MHVQSPQSAAWYFVFWCVFHMVVAGPGISAAQDAPASDEAVSSEAALHDLFEREWAWRTQTYTLEAALSGWSDSIAALPDVSPEALQARAEQTRAFLDELDAIDTEPLSRDDQISAALFRTQLADRLVDHAFGAHEMPMTSQGGFHQALTFLPQRLPFQTEQHYEQYLALLRDMPRYVDQHIAHMRRGLERGMTQPRITLESIVPVVASQVVARADSSTFWRPFADMPDRVPATRQRELRTAGQTAIMDHAVPAYRALLTLLQDEYVPRTRSQIAASALPDGEAYYAHLVRHFTTLDISPDSVHQVGLREVERIRHEMQAVIDTVGFEGDFDAFIDFLRTDPRFYAKTPDELLEEAAWIAKRMDGALPALFGRLPRQPYTVAPVPDHLAPRYTGGRYISASPESTRPGTYWVNTYDLDSRPLYTLEALTLHEAVPGHHLQIALSQELEGLPAFQRNTYLVAFGEGWGLYAERLGLEAGFYTDPYSDFGRLTYEMWRACRLVVDTGMHAKGWSRQRAIDFLAANTALSMREVTTEIDRYISWPGQALGYKMGELTIRTLRQRAEAALGDRFDVRAFHDIVLESGPVTLPVLEENVERWIAAPQGGAPSSASTR